MILKAAFPCVALVSLGACDVPSTTVNLPESVLAIVGPNQDLTSARVLEDDNCYWYDHKGIVETTPLPLRTESGQQICVAKAEPKPAV